MEGRAGLSTLSMARHHLYPLFRWRPSSSAHLNWLTEAGPCSRLCGLRPKVRLPHLGPSHVALQSLPSS